MILHVGRATIVAPGALDTLFHKGLVAARTPWRLKPVLDDAVKLLNFVKVRSTDSRIFWTLFEVLGSIHVCLLTRTEVN
jgi:hypothetical protein